MNLNPTTIRTKLIAGGVLPLMLVAMLSTKEAVGAPGSGSISKFFSPEAVCSTRVALPLKLPTNGWKNFSGGAEDWTCFSNQIEISSNGNPMPNNLAFYAEGLENEVKQVYLMLNVNDGSPLKESKSIDKFLKASNKLSKLITKEDLPSSIQDSIKASKSKSEQVGNFQIEVKRKNFKGSSGGYSLQVTIK